jgi:hypothetical protein
MPVSAALIPSALQVGGGIIQSIFGGNREKKATDALENLKTPTYTQSKGILDYYNEAARRYGINPYQSSMYKYQTGQNAASTAAGLNGLQDRRSAIGGVGRLTAIQNDANLKAGIQAENEQNQRFGELGGAAKMKSGEEQNAFQYNQLLPFQKEMQIQGLKASGGANIMNAGLSNIFGGLGNASTVADDWLLNKNGTNAINSPSGSVFNGRTTSYPRSTGYINRYGSGNTQQGIGG